MFLRPLLGFVRIILSSDLSLSCPKSCIFQQFYKQHCDYAADDTTNNTAPKFLRKHYSQLVQGQVYFRALRTVWRLLNRLILVLFSTLSHHAAEWLYYISTCVVYVARVLAVHWSNNGDSVEKISGINRDQSSSRYITFLYVNDTFVLEERSFKKTEECKHTFVLYLRQF